MSRFAIGDVHGCFDELTELLNNIGFEPGRDSLFFTGDLINRGPKSLEMLRWIKSHDACASFVLGNHDLHLIACHFGVARGDHRDTLGEILEAPDRQALISFLSEAPLTLRERDFFLVHAGMHPNWSLADAELRAREAECILKSAQAPLLLTRTLDDKAPPQKKLTSEVKRARQTLAYLTRIRACSQSGVMNERFTGTESDVPNDERPWFRWPTPSSRELPVIFGHWAALDVMVTPNFVALDSGCVWRRALTAMNLSTREIFQVQAKTLKQG